MSFANLILSQSGVASQNHRPQMIVPKQIHQLFMCQNGIGMGCSAANRQQGENNRASQHGTRTQPAHNLPGID